MKMHSYMSINGYLQNVTKDAEALLAQIKHTAESVGGWDKALQDANARQTRDSTPPEIASGSGTPDVMSSGADGKTSAYVDVGTADAIRKRLVAVNAAGTSTPTMEQAMDALPEMHRTDTGSLTPHVLVDHPDEQIANMAKDWVELDAELESTGVERVRYPNNLTFKNFVVYQLIPTLVYELEYPRTDRLVMLRPGACADCPLTELASVEYGRDISWRSSLPSWARSRCYIL